MGGRVRADREEGLHSRDGLGENAAHEGSIQFPVAYLLKPDGRRSAHQFHGRARCAVGQ